MSRVISVGATHGAEEIIFHLRTISVAEETRYTNRYAEISDLDSVERKAELEYNILTQALASWSEKPPTIKQEGKEVAAPVAATGEEKATTPEAVVTAYFAERTNEKERTAQQVVLQYRRKLQPNVVFY